MSRRYDCSHPTDRIQGRNAAKAALSTGLLAVVPTDTVYGLAADAFSSDGVSSLLAAKGRGRDMPVPVLVGSVATVDGLVAGLSEDGRRLVEAFWPGGLTIVARAQPMLAWDLGDTRGTVAVRMPLHPVALELLAETGPLAVSSANRTGFPPAITVDEAVEQLGDQVSVYLDGGRCADSVPSTIVDLTGEVPRMLRGGAVPLERLRAVVASVQGVAPR